jgi:hypothetical protein
MEKQELALTTPARVCREDFIETVTRAALRAMDAREIQPTARGVQATAATPSTRPKERFLLE